MKKILIYVTVLHYTTRDSNFEYLFQRQDIGGKYCEGPTPGKLIDLKKNIAFMIIIDRINLFCMNQSLNHNDRASITEKLTYDGIIGKLYELKRFVSIASVNNKNLFYFDLFQDNHDNLHHYYGS